MRSLQALTARAGASGGSGGHTAASGPSSAARGGGAAGAGAGQLLQQPPLQPGGAAMRRPEVADDFVRNFLARAGLARAAEAFEAEWYAAKAAGRLSGLATAMPDVYLRNSVRAFPPLLGGGGGREGTGGEAERGKVAGRRRLAVYQRRLPTSSQQNFQRANLE